MAGFLLSLKTIFQYYHISKYRLHTLLIGTVENVLFGKGLNRSTKLTKGSKQVTSTFIGIHFKGDMVSIGQYL